MPTEFCVRVGEKERRVGEEANGEREGGEREETQERERERERQEELPTRARNCLNYLSESEMKWEFLRGKGGAESSLTENGRENNKKEG